LVGWFVALMRQGHETDVSIINGNANYFYLRFYHCVDEWGETATRTAGPGGNIPATTAFSQNKALAFNEEFRQNMNRNDNDSHYRQNGN
jgi:hypothetical protein